MKREPDLIVHRLLPAALAIFAVAASAFRLRSTDVFWHLAAGRWILENRSIPRHDPFRFTSEGLTWVDHEWLFQVLIRGVEMLAGVPGLVVLRQLWVVLLAAVLWWGFRRLGTGVTGATAITLIALLGARPRFLMRPELLTFIALSLLFIGLREYHLHRRRATLAWLAGLIAVWVNLHGEAILGPAVTGLYLLGARLQPWLGSLPEPEPRPVAWVQVFGIPAALGMCLLINPYGWTILAVGAGITGAMRGIDAYNPEWVPVWVSPQPFLLFGFVALVALIILGRRRAGYLHGPTLLAATGLGIVALSAVRHQALFFIGGAFLAAEILARLPAAETERRRAPVWTLWACIAATLWCLAPPSSGPLQPRQGHFTLGYGIEPGRFPEAAADFLEDHPEVGPLFNSFAHGGYLIWRLYPPRQVFHEGRMELQPDLLRQIGETRGSNRAWDQLMERYGAVGALVRIDPRPRPVVTRNELGEMELEGYETANALLFPREHYALVYWDDLVMLFLDRRLDPPRALLDREFHYVFPEDLRATLGRAAGDRETFRGTWTEVERSLSDQPDGRIVQVLMSELEKIRAARGW